MKSKLEQAKQLHQQGKLTEALALYQELLAENSEQSDIQHAIAIIYAQQNNLSRALVEIDKAIEMEPKLAILYNSKGNILLRQKNYSQAASTYQQAIKLKPNYAAALSNLGNCFYRQNKLAAAQKAYEKAIRLNDKIVDAHYNLGILLTRLGEYDQAVTELKKTLSLHSNHAGALGQLAQIYLNKKQYHKAIEIFQKRLQLQPHHIESYHDLGLAYLQNRQYKEAILSFEKALILNPDDKEINYNIATAYLSAGDQDTALTYYLRQLEKNPQVESYYNIAVLLMNKQRHKEAIEYFQQATKHDPSYLPIYLNLGAIYLKLNQVDKAALQYQKALELKPDDSEIKHILAALLADEVPEKAPTEYLQHLFDQYAKYYDKHLTEHLQYKVPQKIYQAFFEETGIDSPELIILDLGCGTGLCGNFFKNCARKLIGVDISEKMIRNARGKAIYDELKTADISDALDEYQDIDLIIAADVFTYIGNLESIFNKIYISLKPNGLFIFSIEKTEVDPYELQQTIRYAHSKMYIQSLITKNHFSVIRFDNIILRQQQRKPVEGYLVLLRKRAP